jgi:hypothetical protein
MRTVSLVLWEDQRLHTTEIVAREHLFGREGQWSSSLF